MAGPKELRAAVIEHRAILQEALRGASEKWDQQPSTGDGSSAWSPREVAKHAISSGWYFTNMISQACGAPAIEQPEPDVSSPAKAAGTLTRVGATCDNVLRHVSDGALTKTAETPIGSLTVERMLALMASRGNEHVEQLKAASA